MQRPATPKGEKPAVTIANLERENDNLANRVAELSKHVVDRERDMNTWRFEANQARQELDHRQAMMVHSNSNLEMAQAKIAKLESVLCGYRTAIADVHGHKTETPV